MKVYFGNAICTIHFKHFAGNQLRSSEVQLEHAYRQLKVKCSCGGMKRGVSTASIRSETSFETPRLTRKSSHVITTTVTKNKKETTFDAETSTYSLFLLRVW